VILDADPLKPARLCACSGGGDAEAMQLPARYRDASFTAFWKWWRDWKGSQDQQLHILQALPELEQLMAMDPAQAGPIEERERLEKLLHQARANPQHGLRPAGAEDLQSWASKGRHRFRGGWELWWIMGPPQSGKTTLACAALRAWGERSGRPGRFASVRTLSQQIKNAYYDQRGWQNADFVSVRDLIEPLKAEALLLLDEMDCLDGDMRVGAAMAELLTHRYHENLPTLLTSIPSPQALEQREGSAFAKLQDESLLRRLKEAERVEMVPALARWTGRK
jgi:DNA replication protein DnaC